MGKKSIFRSIRAHLNTYMYKLVMLPTPQCVVFYNGDRETEDEELLRLSDAFQNKDIPSDLELTVHLRNINLGHNRTLMNQCHKLWEYASLVGRINENLTGGMTKEAAVEEAVTYCMDRGILTDFLKENRSGVLGMLRLLTEYNEKEHMRRLKRDAREEGEIIQCRLCIIDLLEDIAEIPEELLLRINTEENLEALRKWHKFAAKVSDIESFKQKIEPLDTSYKG